MSVLVVAELKGDSLKKVSREMVSAARSLSDQVIALLINGSDDHAGELFSAGADVVVKNSLSADSPQRFARIVAEVAQVRGARVVLMAHSMQGRDCAGRVAVKMNAALVADVVEIKGKEGELELNKPVYSGKAYARMKIHAPAVVTLRPNSQEIVAYNGPETIEASEVGESDEGLILEDVTLSGGSKVTLQDASIIVAGGRGIKGPENWGILEELCDTLGAALGASRAAVDAGWIGHDQQFGPTGKTVSPECYIACGISGAIQHLAGMSSSKYIVAVNTNPEAPIFKVATYGIVDDLFDVVPALTREFKKVLG